MKKIILVSLLCSTFSAQAPDVSVKTVGEKPADVVRDASQKQEDLKASSDELQQKRDQLEKQQQDQTAARIAKIDADGKVLELKQKAADQNGYLSNEDKVALKDQNLKSLQLDNQIKQFQDLTPQFKAIEDQQANIQKSMQEAKAAVNDVQKDPKAVGEVLDSSQAGLREAQNNKNVGAGVADALQALENAEVTVSRQSFKAVVRDFFNSLKTSFLEPLRDALVTVKNNIVNALKLTKAAVDIHTQQLNTINQTIDSYQKQISDLNNQIKQKANVMGFNSLNNFKIDEQFTTAQKLLDALHNDVINHDQFNQIINDTSQALNTAVSNYMQTDLRTYNDAKSQGELSAPYAKLDAVLTDPNSSLEDKTLALLTLYDDLGGKSTDIVSLYKQRLRVLKSLLDIDQLFSLQGEAQKGLENAQVSKTNLLNRINDLKARADDLVNKQSNREQMISTIDQINNQRKVIESDIPKVAQLVLNFELKSLVGADVDASIKSGQDLYQSLKSLDPQAVANDASLSVETRKQLLSSVRDSLQKLKDTVEPVMKEYRDPSKDVAGELDTRLMRVTDNLEKAYQAKRKEEVIDVVKNIFVDDVTRQSLIDSLQKDGKVSIDLKPYGFNEVLQLEATKSMRKNVKALSTLIDDVVFDYFVNHAYELFGLKSDNWSQYTNKQIKDIYETLFHKYTDLDLYADRYKVSDPARMKELQDQALKSKKAARQFSNLIGSKSDREFFNAFREGPDAVKALFTVVNKSGYQDIFWGLGKMKDYVSHVIGDITDMTNAQIQDYNSALQQLTQS